MLCCPLTVVWLGCKCQADPAVKERGQFFTAKHLRHSEAKEALKPGRRATAAIPVWCMHAWTDLPLGMFPPVDGGKLIGKTASASWF